MYRAIRNRSNLFLPTKGIVQIFLNIFISLLKSENDYIYAGKELKWRIKRDGSPSHIQLYFNFNFKLTVPNTYFNPYIVLFGVQIKSFIGRN